MLSNPTPVLQPSHRGHHRRQNSTPVTIDSLKVPTLQTTGLHRQSSHRRGQSLDQRSPIRRPRSQQESVSIANRLNEQQILREAQQQRIARPGQRYQETQSPQCGIQFNDPDYQVMQNMPLDTSVYDNANSVDPLFQQPANVQFATQFPLSPGLPMTGSMGYEGLGLGLDENVGHHYFQQTGNYVYGVPNDVGPHARRMSHPEAHSYVQRPITPVQQANNVRFPLTPSTTPFKRVKTQIPYSKSTQSSPTKQYADETIKASQQPSMQRGRSLQSIFEGQVTHHDLPSPPGTAPLASSSTFDVAMMPTPGLGTIDDFDSDPFEDDLRKPAKSPVRASSPSSSSVQSTPDLIQHGSFDDSARTGRVMTRMLPSSQTVPNLCSSASTSPVRAALSPRRMSISDLNLEPGISASIRETDITLDDIAQFIEGPAPDDNKWICKFEDCNKRFGRKENIKSHVQTHLGDRQFKCDHCNKCFVRGHDLKRHAKIHSGAKPYLCRCGNAFARHDALTRHRQRGMCIGAFDGVVKKVIKRGRPRKHRPEMDDRVDKASKTRQRADEKERQQYASSISDTSVSSYQSPPTDTFESLSIRGSSPFDDMAFFTTEPSEMVGLPPDMFTFTPPASPGFSTGNKPSPTHRSMTPNDLTSIPEMPCSPVPNPTAAVGHQSPPSLCHSSSPVPETTVYDFVDGMMQPAGGAGDLQLKDIERTDFDSFFDYGAAIPEQDDFFGQL